MRQFRLFFGLVLCATLLPGCGESDDTRAQNAAPITEQDPLELLGARASTGAAAGYIDDAICATCHKEIYDSYQHVGMSQSFKRPENAIPVETFGIEYYHDASKRFYKIVENDQRLVFERYQRDANGDSINRIELPIDWVIGSGNKVRSYAYQTDWGEIFMLPLSWYADTGLWRMSPGFEHANHKGVSRKITRECLFCHNAYPEVAAGSDAFWETETVPSVLPEGTGCPRCHGPGADHVSTSAT